MARFLPEPAWTHGTPPRIGVLLVNLGTPEAATPQAVRTYLAEFLADPRVVEIPQALWWLILHGIILRTRPAKSAEKYARIWTAQGSPLRLHTQNQAKMLAGYFAQAGVPDLQVEYAMRYGQPSVEQGLMNLKARHCAQVLVVPLYPQYASSTTGSVFDAVAQAGQRIRNLPEIRFVRGFHDHPAYIAALGQRLFAHWQTEGRPDKLVMSFHGVPKYTLDKGDPYFCECQKTARLLAEYLALKPEDYQVTFQSRFGRTEWLKPYTEATLKALAAQGVKTVDVVCPGFVSDCLETLEEIAIEGKATFLAAGGKSLRAVSCLNTQHDFIVALRTIVQTHIQDWLDRPKPDKDALARSALRAGRMGGA
ncbi:MAG: Protoheme ferro-lyase [Pseudomonadota bacterium]|jgi:ferrochelatase